MQRLSKARSLLFTNTIKLSNWFVLRSGREEIWAALTFLWPGILKLMCNCPFVWNYWEIVLLSHIYNFKSYLCGRLDMKSRIQSNHLDLSIGKVWLNIYLKIFQKSLPVVSFRMSTVHGFYLKNIDWIWRLGKQVIILGSVQLHEMPIHGTSPNILWLAQFSFLKSAFLSVTVLYLINY